MKKRDIWEAEGFTFETRQITQGQEVVLIKNYSQARDCPNRGAAKWCVLRRPSFNHLH